MKRAYLGVVTIMALPGCAEVWGFQDLTGASDAGGSGDDGPAVIGAPGQGSDGSTPSKRDAGSADGGSADAGSADAGSADGGPGSTPGTDGGAPCQPLCCGGPCGGPDHCGGTCMVGTCAGGLTCSAGQCVAPPDAGEIVLVGGQGELGTGMFNGSGFDDTWEWDERRGWTLIGNDVGPHIEDELIESAMASLNGQAVIFGGTDSSNDPLPYTWTFDGTTWPESHGTEPPARSQHAMATLNGSRILLFGGEPLGTGTNAPLGDTWQFDGTNWNPTSPVAGSDPPARVGTAMAALGDSVILFGGAANAGLTGMLDDTWSFEGAGWTRLSPPHSPPARAYHGMVTIGQRVIVYGGLGAGSAILGDTWAFDGNDWTPVAFAGPPARWEHMMGALGGHVLVFGGLDTMSNPLGDTWEFDGTCWSAAYVGPATGGPDARYLAAMAGP